jgi:sulfur carrier protein
LRNKQEVHVIEITVNGEQKQISQTNLQAFLAEFIHSEASFAVAINQHFIPRSDYAITELKSGDDIEILSPMQGG